MAAEPANGRKAETTYSLAEALKLVTNHVLANASYGLPSRARLSSAMKDPRRSLNDECGYPLTEALYFDDYREMYDRNEVAARVVEIMPRESWITRPTVYDSEDPERDTEFEQAWDALGQNLAGAGYYRSETGSPVWTALMRADILGGIGRYGAILLGIKDGKQLREPADGIGEDGKKAGSSAKKTELLYLTPLDEGQAQILGYEQDRTNPRYGQPTRYSVAIGTGGTSSFTATGVGGTANLTREEVHWSRIVHVSEEGKVFSRPRMQTVWNRLYDIQKVASSSGEMYYKGAFPGFALETLPELLMSGRMESLDTEAIKTQLENWMNGLQRYINPVGLSVKNLGTQVVDPTPQVMLYIKLICVLLGVPERIFMGSERGELASSQDRGTWNGRMMQRQETVITPRIVVPFVDRLILLGVLPEPEGKEYFVDWSDLMALTAQEQAAVAVQRTDALVKYVGGNGQSLVQPMDFLTRWLSFSEEEAQEMLDATEEVLDEEQEKQAAVDAAVQEELEKQKPPKPGDQQEEEEQGEEEEPAKSKPPFEKPVTHSFCPTGEGGGVDPSCTRTAENVGAGMGPGSHTSVGGRHPTVGRGGSSAGKIKDIEDSIRSSKVEVGVVVDGSTGEEIHREAGTKDSAISGPSVTKLFKNNIFTHNHPDEEGSPISSSDIQAFMIGDLKEMRAVTQSGTYLISRPDSGWGKSPAKLRDLGFKAGRFAREKLLPMYEKNAASGMGHREALTKAADDINRLASKKYGFSYKFEPK